MSIAAQLKKTLRKFIKPKVAPTIFHITHPKAGSQWIRQILNRCAEDAIVTPHPGGAHLKAPILPAKIYPATFLTYEEYCALPKPKNTKCFVVIRDLRDTLISFYFSLKYSHPLISDNVTNIRKQLLEIDDTEQSILYLLNDMNFAATVAIQNSWLNSPQNFLRYEDLLIHDVELLTPILKLLRIPKKTIQQNIVASRFETMTNRKPGEEDMNSHFRKGIAGDWKNYFTKNITAVFKEKYGELLIQSGYEKNTNW